MLKVYNQETVCNLCKYIQLSFIGATLRVAVRQLPFGCTIRVSISEFRSNLEVIGIHVCNLCSAKENI